MQVEILKNVCLYIKTHEKSGELISNLPGMLEVLVDILFTYSPKLQAGAILAISNIASDISILDRITELGGIGRLEYLQSSPNHAIAKAVTNCYDMIKNCVRNIEIETKLNQKRIVHIKQESFNRCGVGHKLWPAAQIFSKWILDNQNIFIGKSVIEVGAGPGLASIIVAEFASEVITTDYLPIILRMAEINAQLNKKDNIKVKKLNWEEIANGEIPDMKCDIIIGTDVIYEIPLAEQLAHTLDKLLSPDGIFYGVMQETRVGIDEFVAKLIDLGLLVTQTKPKDEYTNDFNVRNIWTFITCSRK